MLRKDVEESRKTKFNGVLATSPQKLLYFWIIQQYIIKSLAIVSSPSRAYNLQQ